MGVKNPLWLGTENMTQNTEHTTHYQTVLTNKQ